MVKYIKAQQTLVLDSKNSSDKRQDFAQGN